MKTRRHRDPSWWQEAKAGRNLRKHGVTFFEARRVLRTDPLLAVYPDDDHSIDEDRWIALGREPYGPVLFIVYTIRHDEPRIISARRATAAEIRRYMSGDAIRDREILTNTSPDPVEGEPVGSDWVAAIDIDDDVAEFFCSSGRVEWALQLLLSEGRAADPKGVEIPMPHIDLDDDAPDEYDFTGKTPVHIGPLFPAAKITRTCVTVPLELYRHFPGVQVINDALRQLIAEGRVPPREA